MFTYTYNAAGRLVRAQSITATLLYTYTADGLRAAQSVQSVPESVDSFSWDWAAAVPELLQTCHLQSAICNPYLIGHETLGLWTGDGWRYYLPDALGSIRQTVNAAGAVVDTREWTPYGVEVGAAQGGPGYTGEWWDAGVGLVYLRARWLDVATGRFTQRDPAEGDQQWPISLQPYLYAHDDPINRVDPAGRDAAPIWPASWAYNLPTPPSTSQIASIDLDRTWIAAHDKPACCQPGNPCQCVPRERAGIVYPANYSRFSTADEYMKYWLAWEYKANPCFYRKEANCMGAALEVSYLYTKPAAWESKVLAEPYLQPNGYGEIDKWWDLVPEFLDQPRHYRGPGTIYAYPIWRHISPYPYHVMVVTSHSLGQPLCFEKQSPGSILPDQYEKWYYQLRPCFDVGLIAGGDFFPEGD